MKENILERNVRKIISDVRQRGDRALLDYTMEYDRVRMRPSDLRIPQGTISRAYSKIDSGALCSIKRASKNIEKFQKKRYISLKRIFGDWTSKKRVRSSASELYAPLDTAGIYIPGGRYAYPSTVLMTAIPARVAGVQRIIVVSPPGRLTSEVLVACDICGVDDIFRVGGAQAIAALAYGTETIPRVDKIFGPGNRYVTEAKRIVFGDVGIDMLAGPTEVVILADKYARDDLVFADLMAQKEHDPDAKATLITTSKELVNRVRILRKRKIELIRVKNLIEACKIVNQRAPEHLEIMVRNPRRVLRYIKNAGAIFLGEMSPVAIGDYWAGPSHVLPTGGASRFSSGLGIEDFLKRISLISFSRDSLRRCANDIVRLAEIEGLMNHAESVKIRLRKRER